MTYILLLLIIAIAPMLIGHSLGKQNKGAAERNPLHSGLLVGGILVAWLGVSILARYYAGTDHPGWSSAEWWAHSGKWYVFAVFMLFFLGFAFSTEAPNIRKKRVILCAFAVLLVIWTTVWRTMPVYAFLPRENERFENGYIKQRVPYTCGPAALGNLMEQRFAIKGVTERELARLAGTTYEGTTTRGLIRAAKKCGLEVKVCRAMSAEEIVSFNEPVLISISTIPAVKHETLFVGMKDGRAWFIDPSTGLWSWPENRFRDIVYGKGLVFEPRQPVAKRGTPKPELEKK